LNANRQVLRSALTLVVGETRPGVTSLLNWAGLLPGLFLSAAVFRQQAQVEGHGVDASGGDIFAKKKPGQWLRVRTD